MPTNGLDAAATPDMMVDVRNTFGLDVAMTVPAFSKPNEYVPDLDAAYVFDRETTLAILAGFAHNRRVLIQGYHGTGKSTHIEQVAARLKMSVRTLSRSLAAAGTSYRAVLDGLRRELSLRHLAGRQFAISEIAFLLGFVELSSFHRAFKRWTGVTPAEYRKQSRRSH